MDNIFLTALHWAAKRGHRNVAQALLDCGADPNITNIKGETAVNLASDGSLVQLLGGPQTTDTPTVKKEESSSFKPHYLAHPPLNPKVDKASKPAIPEPRVMNPAHFHDASQELVLKVRVANSTDPDFIEVEVPEPTFSCLLRICCEELGVAAQRVTRVRKLPNTILRKDRDVQRLQYLQEIELVVESGGMFSLNGELPMSKANATNSYQSISKYKNQTILY
ncbi:hypothetical protein B566_EDAN008006 [Ephemera danica]|nr:hypothetical protein B566_EDAN008006 [Ephemera danica]